MVNYIAANIPFGFGTIISPVINGLLNVIPGALEAVTSAGIGIVITTIKGTVSVINLVFGNLFEDVLDTFITGLEDIASCLATSGDADDTDIPPTQSLRSEYSRRATKGRRQGL